MAAPEPSAAQIDRHVPSVLVVDDNLDIGNIIALALEDSGYQVHVALDLSEAERAYQSFGADVVICDLMLPDGLGSELLLRLSSEGQCGGYPASILMSSHPDAPQHVKQSGADAYIPKPFDLDELCSTVDRLLSQNGGG